jgi:hypothetical protein
MKLRQQLALQYVRAKFGFLSTLSKRKAAEKAFQLFCTPQYRNTKKPSPVFEEAEKIHFEFNDHTIKGYRWNGLSVKKLLILHGYESGIVNFDRYIKPLIAKGYDVFGFDAMAHGLSTGKMINAVLYKELILHINKQYGQIQSFIAHSLGGLALSLALEELEHDETYKIVFIAPATETITAADQFFQFLKLDEGVRNEFDKIIEEQSGHPPSWFSVARVAPHIKAQVLWAQDKEDDMTPFKDIEPVIKAKHPNFKFLITHGLGHRRIYRDHKVVKAIVDFL